jgi:DNA-binding transcriptional LysR family regulator
MDLRQLRYVLAIVDHGSFTGAARAIPVAQPSLSQAIRALETELGVQLFHRTGRRVRLTSAGEALVAGARQVDRDVSTMRAAVDAVRGLEGGTLDLVALPTLAVAPLAEILGRLRREHPAIAVVVAEPEDPAAVANAVAQGDSEVALTELPAPRPGLEAVPLERQELWAILPPGTAITSATLSLPALAAHALVATPPATSTRRLIDEAMAAAGLRATVAVETAHREAIVPLVLAGAGACVLPAPLADQAAARGAVVRRLRPALRRDIGLLHRPGPLSPAAAAFVAIATGRIQAGALPRDNRGTARHPRESAPTWPSGQGLTGLPTDRSVGWLPCSPRPLRRPRHRRPAGRMPTVSTGGRRRRSCSRTCCRCLPS